MLVTAPSREQVKEASKGGEDFMFMVRPTVFG
jgi:hypothetical protein